jgi:hypothetical protein
MFVPLAFGGPSSGGGDSSAEATATGIGTADVDNVFCPSNVGIVDNKVTLTDIDYTNNTLITCTDVDLNQKQSMASIMINAPETSQEINITNPMNVPGITPAEVNMIKGKVEFLAAGKIPKIAGLWRVISANDTVEKAKYFGKAKGEDLLPKILELKTQMIKEGFNGYMLVLKERTTGFTIGGGASLAGSAAPTPAGQAGGIASLIPSYSSVKSNDLVYILGVSGTPAPAEPPVAAAPVAPK